jgi:quercetin dioxygenase-like cupin family protein
MKNRKWTLVLLFLVTGTLMAQQAGHQQPGHHPAPLPTVAEVMTKELPDLRGQEMLMITVEYPPGGADPIHRHNSDAFVYVLEGSIVMQVKGGKEVTLMPGQTFYEGRDDIHLVGRNASSTKPAKFLVFIVKDKGAPALVPVSAN